MARAVNGLAAAAPFVAAQASPRALARCL